MATELASYQRCGSIPGYLSHSALVRGTDFIQPSLSSRNAEHPPAGYPLPFSFATPIYVKLDRTTISAEMVQPRADYSAPRLSLPLLFVLVGLELQVESLHGCELSR